MSEAPLYLLPLSLTKLDFGTCQNISHVAGLTQHNSVTDPDGAGAPIWHRSRPILFKAHRL